MLTARGRPSAASEQASYFSADDVLQHGPVQRQIRHQFLQFAVLLLEEGLDGRLLGGCASIAISHDPVPQKDSGLLVRAGREGQSFRSARLYGNTTVAPKKRGRPATGRDPIVPSCPSASLKP
jgi:hypothetical protein